MLRVLQNTDALFINGFVFDELPQEAVLAAATTARAAGAAVFFDPGACAAWCCSGAESGKLIAVVPAWLRCALVAGCRTADCIPCCCSPLCAAQARGRGPLQTAPARQHWRPC